VVGGEGVRTNFTIPRVPNSVKTLEKAAKQANVGVKDDLQEKIIAAAEKKQKSDKWRAELVEHKKMAENKQKVAKRASQERLEKKQEHTDKKKYEELKSEPTQLCVKP